MDEAVIQKRRWAILAVLVICLLVVILDNTILNVALKTIQQDLGASQSEMQWAVDSYALVFAGLLIPAGVFGDRLGRKTVLLLGMIAFGSTSLLCSYAHTSTELILYRALMGIGAALVQPQTLSIIQNVFPPQERAKAIGIWAGASGVAIALGPITGGLLLKYFWWGSVFLVNVPIVVVGVIAIWFLVPNSKDPHPGRVEPVSIGLLVSSLVILVYGVIQGGNTNDWLAWDSIGAIALGVVLLAYFVYREAHSKSPTIDVHLFENRHFAAGTAAIAFTFFALMGATFYLAYFMQAVRGYTPLAAGVALIAVAAGVMLNAPRAAKLSERFGARVVTGTGMSLFGLAMVTYAFVSATTPQWVIEIQMFVMGSGMGMTMTPATNAIMSAVPREKAGTGAAVNNTVRQVAGALGVAILGSVLAVAFRGGLGTHAPADLAAKLDQPAAAVAQMPADTRVSTYVRSDSSQSIGNAFDFVGDAGKALQRRAQLPQAGALAPAQVAAQKAQATSDINSFVSDAKSSFVDAMGIASICAGLAAWIGAGIAFRYLPKRSDPADSPDGRADSAAADSAAADSATADAAAGAAAAGALMAISDVVVRKRGRPRSELAEAALLDAAIELLAEHGCAGLSVEAVAAKAGVAKSTVYRRWPGKQELLVDALTTVKGPLPQLPAGTVEHQLKWLMEHMRKAWLTGNHGRIMRRLSAEGSENPELYRMFRERVVEPRRAIIRAILERGIREGSIRADIDLESVIGMLAAPTILAVMTHHEHLLTRRQVEFVVETVLAGIARDRT